jgi:hypothetical protein
LYKLWWRWWWTCGEFLINKKYIWWRVWWSWKVIEGMYKYLLNLVSVVSQRKTQLHTMLMHHRRGIATLMKKWNPLD